ncbi:hypothetical protein HAZT_HAZT011495 [Hyalella azteca]|uniref:Glycosyl-hydrolase family 116 catalytic region domain-containing protein n=1 Tax=Hyalella azteca TaxID=294128 RepID=A0A6A0H6M8_HYAAZ|nr:hypothetical protein HAZT_HAZT011495 [Hyalella azteca]
MGMVMEMLLPGVRYLKHFISSILKSKKPFIDLFRLVSSKCMYGVPLGGIGCGTIGRGFRGEFCRFQMTPGNVDFNTAAADQFILTVRSEAGKTLLQKVLSPSSRPKGRKLSAWDWQCNSEIQGRYCGLYPRSWTVYDIPRLQLRLILRQVSPVIPGEYKDSCLPVGVFVWTVENSSSQALQVSICNTFKNGTGGPDDVKGSCWSETRCGDSDAVMLHHTYRGADVTYCLAAPRQTCVAVMESSSKFDTDGDGLIENSGTADQTFDTWVMHGPSAYCCSLWLAALGAMEELADVLGCGEERTKYAQMLTKAQTSMEKKLWNGSYYNFDSCDHPHHLTIMSDQLVGHWYLSLSGNNKEVFKKAHVVTALKTMYEQNVMKFCNGNMGAVNGMKPDGEVDCHTVQSQEMWPGTAFALAATFIKEGMLDEGFRTAEGIYNTTYYETGLAYDMPEALYATGHYRAVGYMRPLSVWSMYRAWCLVNNK